jgi:hypothetical protein
MPRGTEINQNETVQVTGKYLICADPKAGKTTWAVEAAIAGFNVLLMDGDVALAAIAQLPEEAKTRIFYMDVSDKLDGGIEPRMIETVSAFFAASKFLWNDSKQREYSRAKDAHDEETGACLDEIWEFRPARFDERWVIVLDSWTTLSYSGMLAKAQDHGVDLADIEKVDMNLYAGVGNRLTNMLAVIQKARCHFIVLGHPSQFEKTKAPANVRAGEVKAKDRIVEWTKMVPKSSSNPHGLTMGKYFTDVGWIDVGPTGRRELNFIATNQRVSGGHLNSKGDPKGDYSFANCVKNIGGRMPDKSDTSLGQGLIIHPPGTYIPAAAKPALALGAKKPDAKAATPALESQQPTQVKGLGGLMLKK